MDRMVLNDQHIKKIFYINSVTDVHRVEHTHAVGAMDARYGRKVVAR